jgi:hypothetical protein
MKDSTKRVMLDGAIGGLFGAAAIMAWLAVVAAVTGTLSGFYTVFASAYLPLHFAAFAAIGAIGGLVLTEGKWDTALFPPVGIFVTALSIFLVAVVMILGPAESVALPWWNAMVGDLVATATIYSVLLGRHPRIAEDFREAWRGVIGVRTQVICPQTHAPAIVRIDPIRGTIQACSRWPRCYDCPRNCASRT